MKLWFFAKTQDQEYLYVRITNYSAKEMGFNISEVNKLPIFKVKALLFDDFINKINDEAFSARVDIKATRYYLTQMDEIIIKESSFFVKDILKKLPLVQSDKDKLDIIKTCNAKWNR